MDYGEWVEVPSFLQTLRQGRCVEACNQPSSLLDSEKMSDVACDTSRMYTVSSKDVKTCPRLTQYIWRSKPDRIVGLPLVVTQNVPTEDKFWQATARVGAMASGLKREAKPSSALTFASSKTDRKSTRLNSSHLGISYAV